MILKQLITNTYSFVLAIDRFIETTHEHVTWFYEKQGYQVNHDL